MKDWRKNGVRRCFMAGKFFWCLNSHVIQELLICVDVWSCKSQDTLMAVVPKSRDAAASFLLAQSFSIGRFA